MSYDVWMEIDTGGSEPARVSESINYTSNVSPMWALALKQPLKTLDGEIGEKCLPSLRNGIAHMEDEPKGFKALEPDNGWGDYNGALQYLRDIQKMCADHPKAILRMWY